MATKTTRSTKSSPVSYDAKDALIILKNSIRKGKVPAPSDLEIGELALSLYAGEESIWAKNSAGDIVKLNEVTKQDLWEKDFGVFICYDVYENFIQDLEAGSIDQEAIVFVSDSTNRGIWTQGTFYRSFNPDDYYTKEELDENFLTKAEADEKYITEGDEATQEKAGLMSAEDKRRLDNIYDGDLDITAPRIKGEWNIYDNNESFIETSETDELYLDEGFKVQWEGTYKWTHTEGYKDPVSIGPGSNWDVLTESGVDSPTYTTDLISTNTEISIELRAPRTGMTVDERETIISAEGLYDSSEDVVFVKFMNRIYYGVLETNSPIAEEILSLDSELNDGREMVIPKVDCDEDEYYCFAYPKKLGNLSYIRQDGLTLVTGAFGTTEVTVTNDAGVNIVLTVYITNNPGAFTNSSLEFK